MIELKNICKSYQTKSQKVDALKNISFLIDNKDYIAIMGRSGCGKSTLLNILGCMDKYDSGEYLFEGKDIKSLSGKELAYFRNKEIGFVFQAFNLIDDMTVRENIEVPLGYANVPKKKRKARALELLSQVDLYEKANNYPSQLSGGQQQRIAIARALANNPKIILADEPTGNLDYHSGVDIMNLLSECNALGTTIILVTHDTSIASYAKKTVNMFDGNFID